MIMRLLLSPDQDIVIAEPEVEIYPLSRGKNYSSDGM